MGVTANEKALMGRMAIKATKSKASRLIAHNETGDDSVAYPGRY